MIKKHITIMMIMASAGALAEQKKIIENYHNQQILLAKNLINQDFLTEEQTHHMFEAKRSTISFLKRIALSKTLLKIHVTQKIISIPDPATEKASLQKSSQEEQLKQKKLLRLIYKTLTNKSSAHFCYHSKNAGCLISSAPMGYNDFKSKNI